MRNPFTRDMNCACSVGCLATRNMADTGSKAKPTEEAGPEGKPLESDPILAEINKRIEDAFDIFDHESSKTADVR